jgi:hypothetical protein
MASIIFIHGTGTRRIDYEKAFRIVLREIGAKKQDLHIVPCSWGEDLGVRLNLNGASIPTYLSTRAVATTFEQEIAVWRTLYDDPLYELRLLSLRNVPGGELAPGQTPPWIVLQNAVITFDSPPTLKTWLAQLELEQYWLPAWEAIKNSPELTDALHALRSSATEHRTTIARAVVAKLISLANEDHVPIPDGKVRDEMVQQIILGLGGHERGLGGWLWSHGGKGLAAKLATRYAERHRGAITDGAYPFAGDILLYQTRGEGIRRFIEESIKQASDPVTLLAHSLGGVACVDLLVLSNIQKVKQLITVGSQAPFLYEINCLSSLRTGQTLPSHFPPWINLYDKRDILGYIGGGVFGEDRVHDIEVNNDQPFPECHSAYWMNPKVWETIIERLL